MGVAGIERCVDGIDAPEQPQGPGPDGSPGLAPAADAARTGVGRECYAGADEERGEALAVMMTMPIIMIGQGGNLVGNQSGPITVMMRVRRGPLQRKGP